MKITQTDDPYVEMAKLLAAKLDDADLVQLHELMDGDAHHDLTFSVASFVEQKHPELFVGDSAPDAQMGEPDDRPRRQRKPKRKSRGELWAEAINEAKLALDELEAAVEEAKAKVTDTVDALKDIQSEYQEWYDNLPENLQNGATGEKLQAIVDLELDADGIELDLSDIRTAIEDAENVDLPQGFGRD